MLDSELMEVWDSVAEAVSLLPRLLTEVMVVSSSVVRVVKLLVTSEL